MLALCLAAALAFPLAGRAQPLTWTDISGPYGYSRLFELSDGTMYAIEENVLYRSTDAGASWVNIVRPGGAILEFAARGTATVIAVQRSGASNYKQYFASTDRGAIWTRIATEGSAGVVHTNLMLSADGTPHALFPVGSKMAVDRLVDGIWERMGVPSGVYSNPPIAPRMYTVSALDAEGNIYIGTTADGIHSTRNGGQSWTKALPYRYVNSIDFSPGGRAAIGTTPNGRTAGGVFVSDDRGATWSLAELTDVYMNGFRFNGGGDLLVLATRIPGSPCGIYRLDAGSTAWDSTAPFDFDYSLLHVSTDGRYIATGAGLGFLTSDDDGLTWRPDGIRRQDVYSTATAADGSVLAGTIGKGLFRTEDDGAHWERVTTPGTPATFYAMTHVDSTLLAGAGDGLYASADHGVSWVPLTAGLNPGGADLAVYAILPDPSGPIFIGTDAGIFRSVDGALTWAAAGLGSSSVHALSQGPDGTIYAATGADGVHASADGGSSWAPRGLVRPDLQTIAVSDNGQVYVGAASGVFVSTDAGFTWARRIFTPGHVHSVLFNGNFNVFAGSSAGLFVSTDAGQSWASAGLDGLFVVSLAYDADRSITAAVYKGGVFRTTQVISAVDAGPALPVAPALSQNYPNPFNPLTAIDYDVPQRSRVTLRIFDVLGRLAATVVDRVEPAGTHTATWDATGFPSGAYFFVIAIEPEAAPGRRSAPHSFTEVRKTLLLR